MIEKLLLYLSYPFVRNALIAGVLIALCSALLGVTLVLKRLSLIGDGLSHVAFAAMGVAGITGLTNDMHVVIPVTVLCAILLIGPGKRAKIRGDAGVAMVSVGSLALGYLMLNVFNTGPNVSGDVCTTLFGSLSILTLKTYQVVMCIVLSVVVVGVFVVFYNRIFAVTFDEDFMRSTGVNVGLCNYLIAIVIAVVISLAMNLVGSLLISALIIFPALSAMRLFKSFFKVTVASAVISVFCALAGMLAAVVVGTPVGSTIVASDLLVFMICHFFSIAFGGARK